MRKLYHYIEQVWGNASIKKKLIVIAISLVLIPTLILSAFFSIVSVRNLEKNHTSYVRNVMEQADQNIQNRIDSMTYMLYDLSIDKTIQANLRFWQTEDMPLSERLKAKTEVVRSVTRTITRIPEVRGVYLLFDAADGIYISDNRALFLQACGNDEILEGRGSNIWQNEDVKNSVVPVSKELYSLDTLKPLAHMTLFISSDYFLKGLNEIQFGEEGGIFLLENSGHSIWKTLPALMASASFDQQKSATDQLQQLDSGHGFVLHEMQNGYWKILGVVDLSQAQAEIRTLLLDTFGVFFLVACILIFLSIQMSKSISRPIKNLQIYMEKFSTGEFSVTAPAKYRDEIGELRRHFNQMAQKVQNLVNRVYAEENLRQKAQLEALQMQINPHFLYNTLDTINWMAETNGQSGIAAVSRALGALMRYSLLEAQFVPVEQELDAVENYMSIQRYRYGQALHVTLDIDEDIMYENMPKHIILPLIENAMEHGLKDIQGEKILCVTGVLREGNVCITVQDNGKGIEAEKLSGLFCQTVDVEKNHMRIGLRNVDRRMRMIYGEEYGLHIESQPNAGCTVCVRFPPEQPLF